MIMCHSFSDCRTSRRFVTASNQVATFSPFIVYCLRSYLPSFVLLVSLSFHHYVSHFMELIHVYFCQSHLGNSKLRADVYYLKLVKRF